MADDSAIDPRYAAQFQRGFDPERHSAAPVEDAARPPGPVRLAGGPATTAERVASPPLLGAPPPARADPDVVEVDPAHEDEPPARTARWIEWVLPALAGVLLVTAVGFFVETVTPGGAMFQQGDTGDFAWAQIRSTLPGPLLGGAVIALTAWLVLLGGVRSRR